MNFGNKVLCPVCQEKGLTSNVYPGYGVSTAMYCQPYYDENGNYHNHDLNTHSFSYRCSLGHSWKVISGNKCPNCDFGHDDKTEIINSEEIKPDILTDQIKNFTLTGTSFISFTNGTNTLISYEKCSP